VTRIIDIARTADWQDLALAELGAGKCVAVPTETVYGLAADATNGLAVARIFETKGRPKFNPLICHVGSVEMAEAHGELHEAARRLAQAFWPGPLTVVVAKRKQSGIHDLATAGLATVGLRWPKGPAGRLIERYGKPLAAPSANRSGKLSPTTARHVAEEFADIDLLILDGGPCPVGLESTIVRPMIDRVALLRPGTITSEEIETVTGLRVIGVTKGDTIEAPGMLASHYAPRAALVLNATYWPRDAVVLDFGPNPGTPEAAHRFNLSPTGDLREAAANFYDHLKRLDATGTRVIHVTPIPSDGIGAAINDRLARAAAPRTAAR
jgi:L-threonylcarbamoyladenylate synthase